MSSVVIAGDTSGTVTLDAPAVAGTTVLTLPATSGTVVTNTAGTVTQTMVATGVAGTGPAFSAFFSGSQTINDNVSAVVALNNEEFDTNNCFDNVSTFRFTPNVAGYYQISGAVYFSTNTVNFVTAVIAKNGSSLKYGPQAGNGAFTYGSTVCSIVYLNGTTDYVQLLAYQNSGTSKTLQSSAAPLYNYMSGALVRAA
jgi:hypothetical protein